MTAEVLIQELRGKGVILLADGQDLVLRPKSAIPEDLLPKVQRLKADILKALRADLVPPSTPHSSDSFLSLPIDDDASTTEVLRESMQRDFQALLRQAAPIYEELSPTDRKAFFPPWFKLQERMDRAHQDGAWAEFQAALVEAKALLAEAQPDDFPAPARTHWVFRAWSRVLDAEGWFVCGEQEVIQLTRQGVPRGSIYTAAELAELLQLPRPSPEMLHNLHLVKTYFDATVVSRSPLDEESDATTA